MQLEPTKKLLIFTYFSLYAQKVKSTFSLIIFYNVLIKRTHFSLEYAITDFLKTCNERTFFIENNRLVKREKRIE